MNFHRLTFDQDVPGQVPGCGCASLKLEEAPGEQTALQSPEQREQDLPAGSS